MPSIAKLQAPIRVRTPAKITPYLQVLAKRPDGYHDVRLALIPISLFDELIFTQCAGAQPMLSVESTQPLGSVEDNLVYRAIMAFQRAVEDPVGVAVHLVKRIPAGSGLGGGSGNAAGTLVTLNRLAQQPLAEERLRRIAAELGADVPFFLNPRPSRAEGRGDRLRVLPGFPGLTLLVVQPAFAIETRMAYAQVRPRPREDLSDPSSFDEMVGAMENDFESVLFPQYPLLEEVKARLLEAGAAGAMLTGTGSALFGCFLDEGLRDQAHARLQGDARWQVFPCEVLPRHDYHPLKPAP